MTTALQNLTSRSGIEGPQIVVTWELPTDAGVSELKIMKRRQTYPEDYTDGTEVLNDLTMTRTSVVDWGILDNVCWCYQGFTKYTCSTTWVNATIYEEGDRVIPTVPNGFYYEVTTAGTSGGLEPTWPLTLGIEVIDGTITWEVKNTNPGWETDNVQSRYSSFTWDSEYMTRLLFRILPSIYVVEDAASPQVALTATADTDYDGEIRAYHEDGTVERGQLERFLMIYGSLFARVKGAVDFYPQMVNADECLPRYIPRLASLLGMMVDGALPVSDQRALIRNAVAIYRQKGTDDGLARALRSNTSVTDVTVDSMAKHVMVSNRFDKRSATFIDKWATGVTYALGNIIAPSTAFGPLGRVFECTTAGISGGAEPQWVPVWVTTTAYQIDDVIVPTTPNGKALICTIGGMSGGGEPTWPTNFEDTIVDGTVTWVVRTPPLEGIGDTFADGAAEWTTSDARTVYDWALDETAFSWEQPTIDAYGRVTEEAELYSFEILRLWFVLAAGESISDDDLSRIDRVMTEFAPADTRYVVRIEGP